MNNITRGDVWIVDLGDIIGSEIRGKRPCVIVQNNVGNNTSDTTIICPITTTQKTEYPMHVPTDKLRKPSLIKCEHIRAIDKSRLCYRVCRIDMTNIDKAIKLTLGL